MRITQVRNYNSKRELADLFRKADIYDEMVNDCIDELSLWERDYICLRFSLGEYMGERPKTINELTRVYRKNRSYLKAKENEIKSKVKRYFLLQLQQKPAN